MARHKKTNDYLKILLDEGYPNANELTNYYNAWIKSLKISKFKEFHDYIWEEKDNIKPKYLGENSYSNMRGISFEEYCFKVITNILKKIPNNNFELFWNEKIKTEEYFIFNKGKFEISPKYKNVDLTIGKKEKKTIHPIIITSCKTYQSTNWLDDDRGILDNVRNRYPGVVGYSLCMSLNVPEVSKVSATRSGMKLFDLSRSLNEYRVDLKKVLTSFLN